MKKETIYDEITSQIIESIELGAGKFQMPWHREDVSAFLPINIASGKFYRGINILMLWITAEKKGYSEGHWGTFKQWKDKGAKVRKGEKSAPIIFYKPYETEDGAGETITRWYGRPARVFNIQQVEGFEKSTDTDKVASTANINDGIEQLAKRANLKIKHQGSMAFYNAASDVVTMPEKHLFHGTDTLSPQEAYDATLLHELTHASGHESRLNRDLSGRFGSESYAAEELIAEMGAAFLCAKLGVTNAPRADHAQYIEHWLKIMKADKKAIFTAASAASKAADYLEEQFGEL